MNILHKRWQEDPGKAQRLREILTDPVMQEALTLLVENGIPRELTPPEGVPFTEWHATENTRREGYFKFRGDLLALTVVVDPNAPAAIPLRAWDHVRRDAGEAKK